MTLQPTLPRRRRPPVTSPRRKSVAPARRPRRGEEGERRATATAACASQPTLSPSHHIPLLLPLHPPALQKARDECVTLHGKRMRGLCLKGGKRRDTRSPFPSTHSPSPIIALVSHFTLHPLSQAPSPRRAPRSSPPTRSACGRRASTWSEREKKRGERGEGGREGRRAKNGGPRPPAR